MPTRNKREDPAEEYRGTRGMAPFILKFSNRWRWVVNQPPLQICTFYPLIWRLGGPTAGLNVLKM